jgi:UDPglucose--hexose-1-phosphate uridylyltransferase
MKSKSQPSYILQDQITGDWVVIAPGRSARPYGFKPKGKVKDSLVPDGHKGQNIIATYGQGENKMTVIQNLFPVFERTRGVAGWQEVIIEGRRVMRFWDSSVARVAALLDALAERCAALRQDPQIKYLQAFKNDGSSAGATQPHPHAQIYAMSFVPDRLRERAIRRRAALKKLGMSSHRYSLGLATRARIVYSDSRVVAYANPAARLPYEVRILTRREIDNLTQATQDERQSLAKAAHALLPLMKQKKLGFNFFFHDVLDETDEHFEIRFTPRPNIWGGFELDAGIFVNPVSAEAAADEYRKAR